MMKTRTAFCFLGVLALTAGWTLGAVYVDVETEEGTFTIKMDSEARWGGAAFLGLAEGWADWLDPETGEPKHGERYYEGTAMGRILVDGEGEPLLVGNLGRGFTEADGSTNRDNGAGIEMLDDNPGAGKLVAGSVAMVEPAGPFSLNHEPWERVALQAGPYSINGRWAVALKDAEPYYGGRWSRVGMVVSNWAVVKTMAGRATDGDGWMEKPVGVTGTRVHGDVEEIAAWRAEMQEKFPEVKWEAARSTENGIRWMIPGNSRFTMKSTEDLCGIWTTNTYWNEGGACDAGWGELGMTGPKGFLGGRFLTVGYPELSGPAVTDRYSFQVEWDFGEGEENELYQYDLNVGAGTGMVWQLDLATKSNVLDAAACDLLFIGRGGVHCTVVALLISNWQQVPYLWLGERAKGDECGRCRMWNAITQEEVWGEWTAVEARQTESDAEDGTSRRRRNQSGAKTNDSPGAIIPASPWPKRGMCVREEGFAP